ncbi:MAG: 2-hydroxychromene-2-carboxylate isomerase [Hyphomicrobiales bacterium]|nr:2-hydroxychromene-2-carboxylate isomerase [Hyphomicrobiales bacterium]
MRTIEVYFSLASPWAYIGDAHLRALAARHSARIDWRPVSLGQVFPQTGGLPLAKRHISRQNYRLVELQRWREKRGLHFAIEPRGWPFDPTLADCVAVALMLQGADPAPYIAAAFKAVFEQERNLGEAGEIESVVQTTGANGSALVEAARGPKAQVAYAANFERAMKAGVFGSPSYVLDGEIFWGQDRLDLLEDALASGRPPYRAP